MQTFIKKGKEALKEAAELIKNENIVAFPTETVYGLGGSAFSVNSARKIFEAKGRPADNPLICHVSKISDINMLTDTVTDSAYKVFEAFSPGPISVVLKKKDIVPLEVTAGLDSVGIRIPNHDMAREFIDLCGVPIAAPSANKSSRLSPTSAEAVLEDMNGLIPLILDGGSSSVGIESTVLSLVNDKPIILRPGIITLKMLSTVLPNCTNYNGKGDEIKASPGTRHRHYKPLVELVVGRSNDAITFLYNNYKMLGINPIIVATNRVAAGFKGYNAVGIGDNNNEVARNIFKSLRELEKKYDAIITQDFATDEVGESVMNRVNRASKDAI